MGEPDARLQELIDREAIRDCLYRYCRGIDRCDEAALRSAYWEDATDRHGPYQGSAEGFIAWALAALRTAERSIHQITNVLIDFRPGGAAVEAQFSAWQRMSKPDGGLQQMFLMGRYADWFEQRAGQWRISRRTVIYDWVEEQPLPQEPEAVRFGPRQPQGAPWPDDAIYRAFAPVEGDPPREPAAAD